MADDRSNQQGLELKVYLIMLDDGSDQKGWELMIYLNVVDDGGDQELEARHVRLLAAGYGFHHVPLRVESLRHDPRAFLHLRHTPFLLRG